MDSGEDEDIAAAMGFSSFGGAKKRKFDQTNSPRARSDASGANSARLGVRPKVVPDEEQQELQATHDAVVTNTPANEAQPQLHPSMSKAKGKQKQQAVTGLADFLARGQTLPEQPSKAQQTVRSSVQDDTSDAISFGGPPISPAELNALRQGVKDGDGDTAYFLPSFVENPWDKFEKHR